MSFFFYKAEDFYRVLKALKILLFLSQLKNLERKHHLMDEELKQTLLYTRVTLFLTVILAFMMLMQLYFGNTTCADHETLHTTTDDAISPILDATQSKNEL